MGDSQMRWETNGADSVMAALMDMDKLCPKVKQSSHGKQRVLSDAYILKTMFIGRRRESSLPSKRLSRENGGTNKTNVHERRSTHSKNPLLESLSGKCRDDRKVPSKKGEESTKINVLRCREKAGHDFPCNEYMSMSLNSQLQMIDKRCHPYSVSSFDPKPMKKVRDVLQDLKWDYRRYKEQGDHLRPKSEERCDASSKHNCVACSRTMRRSLSGEDLFTKFKDVWIPGNVGNGFQESRENVDNPEVSHCECDDSFVEASKVDQHRNYGSICSESDVAISSKDRGRSFNASEVGSEEQSMNGSHNGESAYTKNYKSSSPKSMDELNGNHQPSPTSVLDVQTSAGFKQFDHEDLWKLLQSFNIELDETFSEESEIVVSDEEDADHTLASLIADDTKMKQWFGDHESKDYSYMVDVLDESRIFGSEPYMDFNTWYSLECPISPSLFEALEMKYGKQTSFDKNHRRLLFDRINSGLASTFNLDINFHVGGTPMKSKFFSCLRRDKVEDELWRILTCQEKAKTQDLSEKAVDEWLEFEQGISIVCSELESVLFDELVFEFLSM